MIAPPSPQSGSEPPAKHIGSQQFINANVEAGGTTPHDDLIPLVIPNLFQGYDAHGH